MNMNIASICIGGAIILAAGVALGMFIIGIFAMRNYDRGYRDGFRESELEKIKKGDILHAG